MKLTSTLTAVFLAPVVLSTAAFGCNKADPHAGQGTAVAPVAGVVAVTAGEDGFQPSRVELAKGQKATLRFTRTTDETCATEVVFPELKLEKKLPLNQPVDIEVPTDAPRVLAFQCGMGMYKSAVVVN